MSGERKIELKVLDPRIGYKLGPGDDRRHDQPADRRATAAAPQPDYRLDVLLVRDLDGPADVTLVLNRVADQRTIWSQQFHLEKSQMPEFAPVDTAIAQIAGDYGVIVRDQVQRHPNDFAPGFPCLAQFNRVRQMRSATAARQIDACLRATLDRTPDDPVALTALSLSARTRMLRRRSRLI